MTNDLGHRLAQMVGDQTTLGAYRLGNRLPRTPGATIDIWAACPRGEVVTGVPPPHVLFMRTRGDDQDPDRGSMFCPECRVELAAIRASGAAPAAPPPRLAAPSTAPSSPPAALPF